MDLISEDSSNVPEISIGLPTRNAGDDFKRLLENLFAQDATQRVEVFALDSGSTDGALDVLTEFGVRIIHIDPDAFDWGRLREQLFEEARGAIVVNLSQDAIPAETRWLENLIQPLRETDAGVSCGSSIPDPERPFG